MDPVQTLKSQLADIAANLCLDYNVKQSEIYELIRATLLNKVNELPKQRVLYNACYGGFGFSKEFNSFYLRDAHDTIHIRDYDSRQLAIPYIIPFAKHVISKILHEYPYFRDMLYTFQKYNLNKVFLCIASIASTERDLALLETNANELRDYLANNSVTPEKPCSVSHWVLTFVKTNFPRYAPQDLQGLLDEYDKGEMQKKHHDSIIQHRDTIMNLVPESIFEKMRTFYDIFERQKKTDEDQYGYSAYRVQARNRFMKLVEKHGLKHNHTWSFQSYYHTCAVAFMFESYQCLNFVYDKSKVFDIFQGKHIDIDEKTLTTVEETFGLLCASSTYAHLKIAEVSASLEWEIAEYDGLEQVQTV